MGKRSLQQPCVPGNNGAVSGCNKNGVNELMRLKIPGLCLMEDFADIVDQLPDGPDPSSCPACLSSPRQVSELQVLQPLGLLALHWVGVHPDP